MIYDTATPYIAAFVVLKRDNKIALVLRQNTAWMNGYYGLVAGKVEQNETFEQAAIREAKEEAGVDLTSQDLKHLITVHRNSPDETGGQQWIDVIFEATTWRGEPYNAEPEKHASLDWFEIDKLPSNIIPVTNFYFEQVSAGKHFAEYAWS